MKIKRIYLLQYNSDECLLSIQFYYDQVITFIILNLMADEQLAFLLPFQQLMKTEFLTLTKSISQFLKVGCKRLVRHAPEISIKHFYQLLKDFTNLGEKYFKYISQTIFSVKTNIPENYQLMNQNKLAVKKIQINIENLFFKESMFGMELIEKMNLDGILINQQQHLIGKVSMQISTQENQFQKSIQRLKQFLPSQISDRMLADLKIQQTKQDDHQFQRKLLKQIDKEIFIQQQQEKDIEEYNKSMLNIQQMIIEQKNIEQNIQERSQLNTCLLHNLIFYYKSMERYYCNQCVKHLSKKNKPQDQKIKCIQHQQQIIYMRKKPQQYTSDKLNQSFQSISEDTQTTSLAQTQKKREIDNKQRQFFCKKCRQLQHERQNQNIAQQYVLLSTCHYLPLFALCQNIQCINDNNFDICTKCVGLKYHKQHPTISSHNFKELVYANQPHILVQIYQQNVIRTKQRLNLQLILNKMISQKMQKISPFLFHINSFIDHNNIEELINLVIQKRDRNAFSRLVSIEKIFNMNLNQQERLVFLEVYQYLLLKKLTQTYSHVNLSMDQFCEYSKNIINLQSNKIQSIFLQKYQTIMIKDKISYYSIDNQMEQIVPKEQFLKNAKKIIIINQINISKNTQDLIFRRRKLYKNLSYQFAYLERMKESIFLSVSNLLTLNRQQYSQFEIEKIDYYKQELSKIQNQQSQQIQNIWLLQLISIDWKRLQIIDIKYYQTLQSPSKIKISAFDLFKIVKNHPQIERINIEGAIITLFDKFIRNLRIYNQYQQYQDRNENINLDQKLNWLKQFSFQRKIKMSIDTQLYFFFKHAEIVIEKIKDLQLLLKFIDLSGIKFMICLQKCQRIDQLSLLLHIIHKMKKARFFIGPLNYQITSLTSQDPFFYLIQNLSKFNSIVQLQFKDIYLQLQQAQHSIIQNLFNSIFQNNLIVRLIINKCNGFPSFKLNTLQTIKILYSSFRYKFAVKQIIENNINLYSIELVYHQRRNQLSQHKLDLKHLNHLRHLQIKYCDFFDDNSLNSLPISSFSTLQLLTIWIHKEDKNQYLKQISKFSLKQFFPLLSRVQSISLSNIDIPASNLLLIPSPDLKELCISNNNQINDLGLSYIGSKWTNLVQLRVRDCKNINKYVFQNWTFNRLALLKLDQGLLKESLILINMIRQGVKINFYNVQQAQIIFRDIYLKDVTKDKKKISKSSYEIDSSFWPSDAYLLELKCFGLQKLTIGNKEINKLVTFKSLQVLLPKLNCLKYLCLWKIDFKGQMFLKIPSFQLQYLHIFYNNQITNEEVLKLAWGLTNLTSLTIYDCSHISGSFLQQCKFKALKQLTINQQLLEESQQIIDCVKNMRSLGLIIQSSFQKHLLKAFEVVYQQVKTKTQSIKEKKQEKRQEKINQGQDVVAELQPKNPYLKKKQIQIIQISTNNHTLDVKGKQLIKCRKHQQQIYYSFNENVEYCNECIKQIKNQKQQCALILCKKHNKIIKFKLSSWYLNKRKVKKIGQSTPQHYLCIQCYKILEQPEKSAKLVLGCHFQQVKQLCTNSECIQKEIYLICQSCNKSDHINHEKIIFQKQVLQSYGCHHIQSNQILSYLIQCNKQSTKKDLIRKIHNLINDQAEKINLFKQFLCIFEVNKQDEMQQAVQSLLLNGKSNKMLILWSLNKIKGQLKGLKKQQSKAHLKNIQDILLDTIHKYLSISFNQINQLYKNFHTKFQTLICLEVEQLSMKMIDKYENIAIIKNQQVQIIRSNILLDQIDKERTKDLIIEIELDQYRLQEAKRIKRTHLINHYIQNILDQFKTNQNQKQIIVQLFLQYEQAKQLPKEHQSFNEIFKIFKSKLLDIELQEQRSAFENFPLFYFIDKKFLHLVNLVINYSFPRNLQSFYQIQALYLFKIVGLNKKLRTLTIEGIKVKDLQEFIKCFMAHQDRYILEYQQDKKRQDEYITWNKSNIICMTKYPLDECQYLTLIDFQDLSIDINASINIKHQSTPFKTRHKLRNIVNFFAKFKSIGGIQLKFDLYGIINLNDNITDIISMAKSIKLHITCKRDIEMITQYDSVYLIFESLKQLTSTRITSIVFQSIRFKTRNIKKLSKIQNNLQSIVQRNTLYLKKVQLQNCIRFPSFSIMQVPLLRLNQSTLSSGNKFDQQLTSLKFLPYNPLNLYLGKVALTNNDRMITKNRLMILRQLTLVDIIGNEDGKQILKDLFFNCCVLSHLTLKSVDIRGQILSITSPYLKKLELFNWTFSYSQQILAIDAKWANLKEITINECKNITASALNKCSFKSLIRLGLGQMLCRQSKGMINKLRGRGIYVKCFNRN